MAEPKVILVTGVSGYWGRRVAEHLVRLPGVYVIGLDSEKPTEEIKDLDFIQADIRNPLLKQLLETEGIDTVFHLAFNETRSPAEAAFDHNVMGTVKVFGACAAAGVKKIIIRSSTAVYGAHPQNSTYLHEKTALKGSLSWGSVRDLVEIESFCNGFRRQAPDVALFVLRFPSIIGPTVDSPMTRFLKEPAAPVLWGFDPLMQVIHEEDAVSALVHCLSSDRQGVYNVAAEGVVPLVKLIHIAGKFPLPVFHLFAYWGSSICDAVGMAAQRFAPFEWDYLRYPWVGDIERMRTELCFVPRYNAEEALREFAGYQRMSIYKPESAALEYDIERLRDTIERRRRAAAQRKADWMPDTEEEDFLEGAVE